MSQRQRRPGRHTPASRHSTSASTTVTDGIEYRVQWRRVDWTPTTATKVRTFSRERDAVAFVDRLGNHDAWGLSPAIVTVSWRPVGAWVEGWPS